ncbi:MAG: multiheme c-type cytochrome [Bacteroidota bacterium]
MKSYIPFYVLLGIILLIITGFAIHAVYMDPKGQYSYDDFETPKYCNQCHSDFYQQWDQAMMSEAYTHHWDEIEYFKLAVAHSENDPDMKGVHEGCNGCHAPLAYAAGDIPPPRPEEGSRANESVSCDFCHVITGYEGDTPFNYNYIIEPGKTKFSTRKGEKESPNHDIVVSELHGTAEFCGICHNEKSSFGVWVKSTHLELEEGPYYEEGVVCQDCHMTEAKGMTAKMGAKYDDVKLHLFHGAHDPGKLRGVVEIRIYPDIQEIIPGEPVVIDVALFNQKTGHKFPTGSVEDRIVWLHVEAKDAAGNVYHLPVDKKGFEGEEYTIASDVLAYQDMGVPLGIDNFEGVRREDVPIGDRIFRMPYFDPQGRMTIMQWNTDSLGVDYRFGPRETKMETFTWEVPFEVEPGKLTITATMNYRLLVKPVGEFLEVPEEEYDIHEVNRQMVSVEVIP